VNARAWGRLAWPLLLLFIGVAVVGTILQEVNGDVAPSEYLTALGFTSIGVFGAFLAARRPENPVGWLFLVASFSAALGFFLGEYAEFAITGRERAWPGATIAAWLSGFTWLPALVLLGVYLLLVFPDGRLLSRRWRLVAWGAGVVAALVILALAVSSEDLDIGVPVANPFAVPALDSSADAVSGIGLVVIGGFAVLSAVSLGIRYRRSGSDERHQLKWFLFAGLFLALNVALGGVIPEPVSNVTFTAGLFLLPAAATVAVLKYRLYDIDVVINKAVVLAVLAAFITLIYVGLVIGIGALVGGGGNVVLSIAATAVIAVAFQPVRDRARRFANRLVYGKRATPYEVLSEFSGRMAGAYSTEDVLPRMARILAEGTGAVRADVWLHLGSELRRAAAWPPSNGERPTSMLIDGGQLPTVVDADRTYPVRHQGELLGALSVAKPPSEPLTPAEDRLVEDMASQAGLVLRNVRLIEELRASRLRLVAAQDEERRRIERNIHDGAQQQLVAIAVKQRLAQAMIERDPGQAGALLFDLQAETQDALDNLRDLARGIYPPVLSDQGLAAALEAQARRTAVPVELEADGIGRYPQEAEAAVYFCVLEALQNVAKYARASTAVVRLQVVDGELRFEVIDNGVGFDPVTTPRGSGTQNMADRLAALGGAFEIRSKPGGGTTIIGRLPARTEERA
jgi:signal transduction histidine kinase